MVLGHDGAPNPAPGESAVQAPWLTKVVYMSADGLTIDFSRFGSRYNELAGDAEVKIALEAYPEAKVLLLKGSAITEELRPPPNTGKNLERINFDSTGVSDKAVTAFMERSLGISTLILSTTRITEGFTLPPETGQALETVNFSYTRATEATVESFIKGCLHLRYLDVYASNVLPTSYYKIPSRITLFMTPDERFDKQRHSHNLTQMMQRLYERDFPPLVPDQAVLLEQRAKILSMIFCVLVQQDFGHPPIKKS